MKWTNKGHEFDTVFQSICKKSGFYLFGAGHDGKQVLNIIRTNFPGITILGFVDNNPAKQGLDYCGLPVFSPSFINYLQTNTGIIISIGADFQKDKEEQLNQLGLTKNADYFHYYIFLMVFAAYAQNKILIPNVNFIPGTYCNLNCKACLNFKPYIKKFYSKSLQECKNDIDLFFSVVDYVGLFCITGGEPLLYPHIGELISYVDDQYGAKIYSLETITNGTIIPRKDFLDAYRDHKIVLTVDDYRDQLPNTAEIFNEVLSSLDKTESKGKYVVKKYDDWIQLYPFEKNEDLDDEGLCKKYNSCHIPWQNYSESKLYSCNYAKYAADAGIGPIPEDNESLDLRKIDKKKDAKLVVEFRSGYTDKGYVEFCKHCGGYMDINEIHVPAALQEINK